MGNEMKTDNRSLFAKWSPCIYEGAITCAECDRSKPTDPDERCDMAAGRTLRQQAFDAGWKRAKEEVE